MGEGRLTSAIVFAIFAGITYGVLRFYMTDEPSVSPDVTQETSPPAYAPAPAGPTPTAPGAAPAAQDPFLVDGDAHLVAMLTESIRACPAWNDYFSQKREEGAGEDARLVKFNVSEKRETDDSAAYAGGSHLPGKVTVSLAAFEMGKAVMVFNGSLEKELSVSRYASRGAPGAQEGAFNHAEREALSELAFESAFATLVREGTDEVIARVGKAVESRNPSAGRAAMRALAGLGRRAKPAMPSLVHALAHQDETVSASAAALLGAMGSDAVPELVKLLSHRHRSVVLKVLAALGDMGSDAEDAVPALVDLLAGSRYNREVGDVLVKIGRSAVAPLVEVLEDPQARSRREAAEILGNMGYDARAAIPALKAVVADQKSYRVRRSAEEALEKITTAKPSGIRKINKK